MHLHLRGCRYRVFITSSFGELVGLVRVSEHFFCSLFFFFSNLPASSFPFQLPPGCKRAALCVGRKAVACTKSKLPGSYTIGLGHELSDYISMNESS